MAAPPLTEPLGTLAGHHLPAWITFAPTGAPERCWYWRRALLHRQEGLQSTVRDWDTARPEWTDNLLKADIEQEIKVLARERRAAWALYRALCAQTLPVLWDAWYTYLRHQNVARIWYYEVYSTGIWSIRHDLESDSEQDTTDEAPPEWPLCPVCGAPVHIAHIGALWDCSNPRCRFAHPLGPDWEGLDRRSEPSPVSVPKKSSRRDWHQ